MHIDVITIHPDIFEGPLTQSIIKRAVKKEKFSYKLHNLRDYSANSYGSVDDYPYGGGGGMVMMVEPVDKCITALKEERSYNDIIYTSPDGELFNQPMANQLSMQKNLIILCGHYKGIDDRIREHLITKEISIGNYVLTGGELAAAVIIDSIVRLIPGVLGDEQSALTDSYQDGLIAPPIYTRPANYNGWKVPGVLLSGHDKEIADWRLEKSIERTRNRRPELL